MFSSTTKTTMKKILLWLVTSYPFGFIVGAIIATFAFGAEPGIYAFGLMFSLYYAGFVGAPVFLVLVTLYSFLNKKIKLDQSWMSIGFLTLIIALISSGIIIRLMGISIWNDHRLNTMNFSISLIFFFGTWLGTLLPRIFIKSLKPGNIL